MLKVKHRLRLLFLIFLLVAIIAVSSPVFLTYSSDFKKTEAIVLFLGPDFSARQKEAYRLINAGMADYLIIPAYRKTYKINSEGEKKYLSLKEPLYSQKQVYDTHKFPNYFEDTHIEIMQANKIMRFHNLSSAIFVSSPYHMRRIRIMAEKIFDLKQGEYYFVPTSFEKAPVMFWELSWTDWKKVGREVGKIIWFQIYRLWT